MSRPGLPAKAGFKKEAIMKLYVRFGSLVKFQNLYDSNEYLQKVLSQTKSNVYFIETDDLTEIERLLKSRNINYKILDE